jgi:hypothetical protein
MKSIAYIILSFCLLAVYSFAKDKELRNYEFQGIIKQGPIMGLWENAKLNKSFAFYAYPIKQMDK